MFQEHFLTKDIDIKDFGMKHSLLHYSSVIVLLFIHPQFPKP